MVAVTILLLTVFVIVSPIDSTKDQTYQVPLAINTWAFTNATSLGKN